MELSNCKKCGKLFSPKVSEEVCPVCRDEEEEKFQKVKDYLWDHPKATVEEVHEETGVEEELIIKFVKDGRLIAEGLDLENIVLECERCGTAIANGRFCSSCKDELVDGFTGETEDKKEDTKPEKDGSKTMHLKDRINRRKGKR